MAVVRVNGIIAREDFVKVNIYIEDDTNPQSIREDWAIWLAKKVRLGSFGVGEINLFEADHEGEFGVENFFGWN